MELWILLTFGAAFGQNLRSYWQRRLTDTLSTNGAAYVRFLYALPFALVYWLALAAPNASWPAPHGEFLLYAALGGVAQVLATAFLVASFTYRNFAVGTAFSKTEAAQAAVFGALFLGDGMTGLGVLAIALSFAGVVLLSTQGELRLLLKVDRALVLGLLAGAGFAVSAVAFRAASLSLPDGGYLERAAFTLLVALLVQTGLMGCYLALRQPGELQRVWSARRVGIWVGLVGMLASVGWFTAMTLAPAGLVRTVGQVELVFTFLTTALVLRERVTLSEVFGALLVVGGIALLL